MRAYLTDGQWEKKQELIKKIEKAAKDIATALLYKVSREFLVCITCMVLTFVCNTCVSQEVPKTEVYAVKMLLQSTAKKLETHIRNNEISSDAIAYGVWQELVREAERVDEMYNKMQ
ncbi:hypothetical protein EON63_17915 [archaeon]|nr:MAG: hypothetical protein EON63_17915 [archaeon]